MTEWSEGQLQAASDALRGIGGNHIMDVISTRMLAESLPQYPAHAAMPKSVYNNGVARAFEWLRNDNSKPLLPLTF